MNSKPLINDGRQIPVYEIHTGPGKGVMCIARKDFEDLDAERRRLRQALIDRGVDPNDIPPVILTPKPLPPKDAQKMPLYKSHKFVWALKIARVEYELGRTYLFFEDPGHEPISKAPSWDAKFNPHVGGYLVVYADGYTSFSPAQAFEEGYTRVET